MLRSSSVFHAGVCCVYSVARWPAWSSDWAGGWKRLPPCEKASGRDREAMGNRERTALSRNKERGIGCSVSCCPSGLGVRLKGGITPHSIQSMLTI
jgi:hypothetical protein